MMVVQDRDQDAGRIEIERRDVVMKKVYFSISGMRHYFGTDFLERGDEVMLIKEPDNDYDKEAIRVEIEGLGKMIGYVANSVNTVLGECFSAGRLYDHIKDHDIAKVKYITERGVVCEIKKK